MEELSQHGFIGLRAGERERDGGGGEGGREVRVRGVISRWIYRTESWEERERGTEGRREGLRVRVGGVISGMDLWD